MRLDHVSFHNVIGIQVSKLLAVNRASLCAVFDHYATAVVSAKHAKSVALAQCDVDPTAVELTRDALPTRRMSLSQLCLFCQDFGILPALCDIVCIQVTSVCGG
jgi:hypothetical protein